MKLIKILLILALSACAAMANDFKAENFTYGFKVETSGNEINSLVLPANVYIHAASPRLTDIMVFNAAGESVPFTLVRPKPQRYETPAPRALSSFPLFKEVKEGDKSYEVMNELIIDLRGLDYMPSSLIFRFEQGAHFNDTVRMSVSTGDLTSWSSIGSANIAQLKSSSDLIVSDTVKLQSLSAGSKYLRIQTDNRNTLTKILSVDAEFSPVPVYPEPRVLHVNGSKQENGDILFDLGGAYPVEWVDFGIEYSYLFLGFKMSGRYFEEEKWAELFSRGGVSRYHYNKNIEGTSISGRYRAYLLDAVDNLPASADASFYWNPDILVFLSKGDERTYTVAYGSKYYKPDSAAFAASNRLKDSLDKASQVVSMSELIKVGDGMPPYDLPELKKEDSMTFTYIMIGVIALAILLLSFAAMRLLKDVNTK